MKEVKPERMMMTVVKEKIAMKAVKEEYLQWQPPVNPLCP